MLEHHPCLRWRLEKGRKKDLQVVLVWARLTSVVAAPLMSVVVVPRVAAPLMAAPVVAAPAVAVPLVAVPVVAAMAVWAWVGKAAVAENLVMEKRVAEMRMAPAVARAVQPAESRSGALCVELLGRSYTRIILG